MVLVGLLLATLGIALVAVAYLAYDRLTHRGPRLRASVIQAATGEVLRLELPDARPGTIVRYAGNARPVENGAVELPIRADALHIGDNVLEVEVVDGASTSTLPITLTLEYRAHADLAGLASTPPSLAVVLEALPGSSAEVNGAAITLDATGTGRLEIPTASLPSDADGALTLAASYSVTPPGGELARGTLTARVPLTPLVLERPLDGGVTDRATITLTGRTATPDAGAAAVTLSVDGRDVPVGADGRFLAELPLPEPDGEGVTTLQLVARRAGNAPHVVDLHVRRVASLRAAASAVAVDRGVGYDRLQAAPDEVRGRVVAFEGEVYNTDVQRGEGILQLLVRGCTRADRCPLWVTYAAVDPIATHTSVRVVGRAAGMQQFRAESGELRSVPHLEADFVVPSP